MLSKFRVSMENSKSRASTPEANLHDCTAHSRSVAECRSTSALIDCTPTAAELDALRLSAAGGVMYTSSVASVPVAGQ
jgi:hypothetical protein